MKKIALFCTLILFNGVTSQAQFFIKKTKQPVDGITGTLTLHPDSITIKGSDNKVYFFFFDSKNKCLLITENQQIYKVFADFLPEKKIDGRVIQVEGTSIDPFTLFSKKQLQLEGRRIGLALNSYKLYKIFNYGLITDRVIFK